MSVIYLIRHGQAGTRDDYDSLSDLGRSQAKLAGEYFRSQGIRFTAAYSGSLVRQQATAREAGANFVIDPGWDEFDLTRVLQELAPRLSEDDEEFRIDYEEMQRSIAQNDPAVHRKWHACDRKCVKAWLDGRYEYSGESWTSFVARIHAALARVVDAAHEGNVAVFTSATPIGLSAARTLKIADGRAMWLAGVMFNASITTLRAHDGEVRLFTMNGTPHLNSPELRTFR